MTVWEFACRHCGHEEEVPADETDWKPTGIQMPLCEECGEITTHVGPVVDTCDRCHQDLLYHGNSGLGRDTLCESCYERLEVMM